MKFPETKVLAGPNGEVNVVLHHIDGFQTPVIRHIDDYKGLLDSGEFFQSKKEAAYHKNNKKSAPKKEKKSKTTKTESAEKTKD